MDPEQYFKANRNTSLLFASFWYVAHTIACVHDLSVVPILHVFMDYHIDDLIISITIISRYQYLCFGYMCDDNISVTAKQSLGNISNKSTGRLHMKDILKENVSFI